MSSTSHRGALRRAAAAASCVAIAAMLLGACTSTSESAAGSPAPNDARLPVAFALTRDAEGLYSAAMERSTPSDPAFRTWLDAAQIADRFGAPAQAAQRVLAEASRAGFQGSIDPTRGLITGTMTTAQAERLLGVTMQTVPVGTSQVIKPSAPPTVPRAWTGTVTAVMGLTLQIPAAGSEPATVSRPTSANPAEVSCPPSPGSSALMRDYYGMGSLNAAGAGGRGVRIALLQIDRTSQVAIGQVRRCYGVTIPTVDTVKVDATDDSVYGTDTEESTLDIAAASLVAPNLEGITTYQFNPFSTIVFPLAASIGDALRPGGAQIISTSIGYCEPDVDTATVATSEWLFSAAAAAGITVLAAAGDTGSSACAPESTAEASQYPASSALVTAVGGTQFTYAAGAIAAEVVWNASPSVRNAGGGTPRSQRPRPHYQDGIGLPGTRRAVPDVAFVAAPATFGPIPVCDAAGVCTLKSVGGTSATAPGVAGALSEVMDAIETSDDAPYRLGLLNPTIYSLARDPAAAGAFVDVTAGTNDLFGVGCCTAAPGFDGATGWGSIRFGEFLRLVPR
ncbi:MAG: protease pro-enzyme activation domain-containing protein [Candidatus Nanopelagicales bacterium]